MNSYYKLYKLRVIHTLKDRHAITYPYTCGWCFLKTFILKEGIYCFNCFCNNRKLNLLQLNYFKQATEVIYLPCGTGLVISDADR